MTTTPLHLWILGVLSLRWNAGGAMDDLMTRTHAAAYLVQQPVDRLILPGVWLFTRAMTRAGVLC